MSSFAGKSFKPYSIWAHIAWIEESGFTPRVHFEITSDTLVPEEFMTQRSLILNVGGSSTQGMMINEEGMSFKTRFNRVSHNIKIPLRCIQAISFDKGPIFDLSDPKLDVPLQVLADHKRNIEQKPTPTPAQPISSKAVAEVTASSNRANSPEAAKLQVLIGGSAGDRKPTGKLRLIQ